MNDKVFFCIRAMSGIPFAISINQEETGQIKTIHQGCSPDNYEEGLR